jgi:hypothetical protein
VSADSTFNQAMSYDHMGPQGGLKGFDQCGNAQAMANEQQIIITADVTDQANAVRQTVPMMNQTMTNLMQPV